MQPEKQPRKQEPPLSLHPLTFDQAIDRLLKVKPAKKSKPNPKRAETKAN